MNDQLFFRRAYQRPDGPSKAKRRRRCKPRCSQRSLVGIDQRPCASSVPCIEQRTDIQCDATIGFDNPAVMLTCQPRPNQHHPAVQIFRYGQGNLLHPVNVLRTYRCTMLACLNIYRLTWHQNFVNLDPKALSNSSDKPGSRGNQTDMSLRRDQVIPEA